MSGPVHLARRFLGSLSRRPLDSADGRWVQDVLRPGERALWDRMPLADRKHAAGVAREVDAALGGADDPVLAAALLHDVGKVTTDLGTFGHVLATVVGMVVGRDRTARWPENGWRGRVSRYLRHDRLGAELLTAAGSDPLTVAWAREHHLDRARWTLDLTVADALAAADDD